MRLRRTAAIAATVGALALSLVSAPAAQAAASPSTVTITYDFQSSSYVLSSSTVGANIGDTFTFTNGMLQTDVQLINDDGFVLNNTGFVPCVASGDCPITAGASMTVDISGLGTVFVKDVTGTSTMATLTLTEPMASDASGQTAPALDTIYPTAYVSANGGTCTGTLQFTKHAGQNAGFVTPTSSTCTRTGYSLAGWARTSDASTSEWAAGADVPIGDTSFTVYAVWRPNGVEVTYDANVGLSTPCLSNGVNQETYAARQAGPYVLTTADSFASTAPCAPDGYNLLGWATTPDGPVTASPGEPLSTIRSATSAKLRAISPEGTVSDVSSQQCCPTGLRSSKGPRAVAPIDSSACQKSAQVRVVDISSLVDQQSLACGAATTPEPVTLYAVWGRDITVDCPSTRGMAVWTYSCTDFGDVPVGATATLAVRITNNSVKAQSLQLRPWPTGMVVNGSLRIVTTTCATLPAKGTCTLTLAWAPAHTGGLGTVPLIMCQNGNVNQCYQPAASEQLRGNALPPQSLVSYAVELSAAASGVLPGTTTTLTVRPTRNDAAMPGASVALALSPGLTFADGTTTTTVAADYDGVARATVLGSTVGSASVTAAYGNVTSTLALAVSNVLVEFDKTSINDGEQATATITATPNTRIKYTTTGKLAARNPGFACGTAGSARYWGTIAGISREAATVVTDASGHATVETCGLLAPGARGTSLTSTAQATAVGPGSLLALPAEAASYCGSNGCEWTASDAAAATTASLDVRTSIDLAVSAGDVPVVASTPTRSALAPYPAGHGVTLSITDHMSPNNRLYAYDVTLEPNAHFWIANKYETSVTAGNGPFLYSASFLSPLHDDWRMYLTSGMQLRLYYVRGTGLQPSMTVDLILSDPYVPAGSKSYVVFPEAVAIRAPFGATAGTTVPLTVECTSTMGVNCTAR